MPCGIESGGTAACWGSNMYGQSNALSGTFVCQPVEPYMWQRVVVQFSVGGVMPTVSRMTEWCICGYITGYDHTCALMYTGTVQCWGSDTHGQSSPPSGAFTQISSLQAADRAMVWFNVGDVMILDSLVHRSGIFSQVSPLLHTCGIRNNGTAQCWGDFVFGDAVTAPSYVYPSVCGWISFVCYTAEWYSAVLGN